MIRINAHAAIHPDDLSFTFDRSSGPGGQNVNKVNTRVTLRFHVAAARSLSDEQRRRVLDAHASRIDADGRLRVVCDVHRTQAANRAEAVRRLLDLLRNALRPRRVRRPTRATAASRERRLSNKTHRGRVKRDRLWRGDAE